VGDIKSAFARLRRDKAVTVSAVVKTMAGQARLRRTSAVAKAMAGHVAGARRIPVFGVPPSLKLWRDKSGHQPGAGQRNFGLAMANYGFAGSSCAKASAVVETMAGQAGGQGVL